MSVLVIKKTYSIQAAQRRCKIVFDAGDKNNIPTFINITEGSVNEINAYDIPLEAGNLIRFSTFAGVL